MMKFTNVFSIRSVAVSTAILGCCLIALTQNGLAQRGPAWSRGVQLMEFGMDECRNRARRALALEGYNVVADNTGFAGTDFYLSGQTVSNTAVIACNSITPARSWVNMFIASTIEAPTGSLSDGERVKLQTRMGQAGGAGGGSRSVYSGIFGAYAWDTITLEETGNGVTGWYTGLGSGTLQGTVRGDRFFFSFRHKDGTVGEAILYPIDANTGRYGLTYCSGRGCTPTPSTGYVDASKRR